MRLLNRLLAALLSLALIVIGLLVIIEVTAFHTNDRKPAIVRWHTFYSWAGRTKWQAGSVRVTCIVLAVLGLILLVAELKRSRVTRIAAATTGSGIDTAYTRRGLAASVRSAVTNVDGIRAARVTVMRRRVQVAATAGAKDDAAAQSLREPAAHAAKQRLESLGLRSVPAVKVRLSPRSK